MELPCEPIKLSIFNLAFNHGIEGVLLVAGEIRVPVVSDIIKPIYLVGYYPSVPVQVLLYLVKCKPVRVVQGFGVINGQIPLVMSG